MTTGVVIYIYIFFFRRRELRERDGEKGGGEEWRKRGTGDARDISNFLITPRGANDLPLAHPSHPPLISPFLSVSPLSSRSIPLAPSFLPFVLSNANPSRHRYNVASFHPHPLPPNHLPTVPLFNLTPTSHQSEPLLYLLLRYRSALSPGTCCNMRLGTREIYAKSRRRESRGAPRERLFLSFRQIPLSLTTVRPRVRILETEERACDRYH